MNKLQYFLFPHSAVSETNIRHLAILLPHVHLMEIARPLKIPEWASDFLKPWRILSGRSQIEYIRNILKEYQEMANRLGDTAAIASMSRFLSEKESYESRFRIQSVLRGHPAEQEDSKQAFVSEAAVFLEMASDLDTQGMDLEMDIARVGKRESEFKDILGISGPDEEETLESDRLPLAAERSYLTFMLPRRIGFWLRLFCTQEVNGQPVLVAVCPEAVDELVDPFVTVSQLADHKVSMIQVPMASLPSLETLAPERFEKLFEELRTSEILTSYWECLEQVIIAPGESAFREELEKSAELLFDFVHRWVGSEKTSVGDEQVKLSLSVLQGVTLQELQKKFDKEGLGLSGLEESFDSPIVILLCA